MATSTVKRGSLAVTNPSSRLSEGSGRQQEYQRGMSLGGGESGARSYTPRNFKPTNLTLTYDRSRMKRPSVSDSQSPMEEGAESALKQAASEDSYIPKIAAHTKNWPSFLARNYYRLHSVKLGLTLLINVILLTYQVSGGWGQARGVARGLRWLVVRRKG